MATYHCLRSRSDDHRPASYKRMTRSYLAGPDEEKRCAASHNALVPLDQEAQKGGKRLGRTGKGWVRGGGKWDYTESGTHP